MKARNVLGIIASIVLILSSGAHSVMGWKVLGAQLATTNAPADLISGLHLGWEFGGMAMLTFGLIALTMFVRRMRGTSVWMLPATLIAGFYILFGAWALFVSRDPFFLIMLVPGMLLLAASR